MDSHTLKILEFESVRAQLRPFAACSLGGEEIDRLKPETNMLRIRNLLREVNEVRKVIDLRGQPPFGGIRDIRLSLEKASVAGILQPDELLDVCGTMQGARNLQAFLKKSAEEAPSLADLAKTISTFPKIEAEIERCITPKAEVADNASSQLQTIRQRLRITHNRMIDKLNSFLRSAETKQMLQDPVITIRDGRYCLPVKAENKREFGGLVHDSSASGATVFMEPQAVVDLGNEIRELQIKEEQEVERILRTLAGLIASQIVPLQATARTLGRLDLITAKGRWANDIDAIEPELSDEGRLKLRGARHPLLSGNVVPIDLELGGVHKALLITGPNTGGKTVTLKTVGLLTLMTQAGLPIPAEEGSVIAVFPKIYADIGDEQSIQQSLSTFSSHIRQVVKILGEADDRTLVLLDELGAGTDPAEGAALAKSILKNLLDRDARIMATTHYGELKEFAFVEPGCRNASVEFDEETLKPTYRLLIGVPGSSNALSIASRLGIPDEVIQSAREMFNPDRAALESIYREMESDRRSAEKNNAAAQSARAEAERLRQQFLQEHERLQRRKERETENAVQHARDIVKKAKAEAEAILADLRKQEREGKGTEMARLRLKRVEGRVDRMQRKRRDAPPEEMELPVTTREQRLDGAPEPGDEVLLAQFGQKGILLRQGDDSSEVQVGAMRLTVPTRSLLKVKPTVRDPSMGGGAGIGAVSLQRALQIRDELDLRGQRADEALINLEKYLDDARIAGLAKVRVIHGKGLGALRKIVWEAAKTDPTIRGIAEAPPEEGGAGVSMIEFR